MKKLFKKVVALAAGASFVGATMMGAMAADLSDYPAPFIADGTFDAIMVVGDTAAPADIIGVTDIAMSLQFASKIASTSSGTGAVSVSASGEAHKIETGTNKLNMGNILYGGSGVQTTPIDNGDLPNLLADGTYRNDEGSDFKYEQEIIINDTTSGTVADPTHMLAHFADSDYNDKEPTVGVRFKRNLPLLQYKLKFTKSAKTDMTSTTFEDLEDTDITILGKEYNIVDATNGSSAAQLELMGGAIKDTLEEGQVKTYTLDGKTYEVENVIVTDTGTLYTQFKVNGETTKKMQEGQTDKLDDGTQVGIRTILQNEAGDVTQDMVEFYLGADKLKIEDNDACVSAEDYDTNVELNDDDIDDLYGDLYFDECDNTPTLNRITVTWKPDDDTFITQDNSETLPGLGSFKLNFEGLTTPKAETIAIENSGTNQLIVKFPIDGKPEGLSIDVLYSNATNWLRVGGSDTDEVLYTADTCAAFNYTKSTHRYFVASDSVAEESHLVEATTFKTESSVNKVTFKDAATGTKYEDKRSGDVFTIGDVSITVGTVDKTAEVVRVTVTGSNAVCDKLYTPEGLTMHLPVNNGAAAASTTGYINLTAVPTSWNLVMVEEDKDETLEGGHAFLIPTSVDTANSGRVSVGTISNITNYEVGDTDKYEGYVRSDMATKLMYDTSPDQDTAEVEYHGEESYGNLYVSSTGTTFKSTAGSSGTATEVVKIEVGATQLASKVAGRETSENLIIVGGPCVNTAAAVIMGNPADCAADFSPGKAKIKLYEHDNGKVALLVAGYAAADTTAASQIVANYDDPAYAGDFSGTELEVTETTSSQPQIGPPTVIEAAEAEVEVAE